MKSYNQFINESRNVNIEDDLSQKDLSQILYFKFSIEVRNSTKNEKNSIIQEFEKYFKISDEIRNYLFNGRPWAWTFDLHKSKSFNNIWFEYGVIASKDWGKGIKYMEDIITPKEFLSVGLSGVKEYIESGIGPEMKKYNM